MIVGIYLIIAGIALSACEFILYKSASHSDSGVAIVACVIVMVFDAVFSSWVFAAGIAICINSFISGKSSRRGKKCGT
jgi:hypothetical protein